MLLLSFQLTTAMCGEIVWNSLSFEFDSIALQGPEQVIVRQPIVMHGWLLLFWGIHAAGLNGKILGMHISREETIQYDRRRSILD